MNINDTNNSDIKAENPTAEIRQIKGYDNFFIGTNGNVYKGTLLLQPFVRSGSLCVKLNGLEKRVKKLMVETFLPDLYQDKKLGFKDGDITNCSLDNLAFDIERNVHTTVQKLSCDDILEIVRLKQEGKTKPRLIADQFGINTRYVYKIVKQEVRKECFI